MNEEMLFGQLQFVRNATLSLLKDVTEEMADIIPAGFKNNIRWHLGHVYLVQENVAVGSAGLHREIPENFKEWFQPGTSPVDWTEHPINLERLKEVLTEQPKRVTEMLAGRIDQQLKSPFQIRNGPVWTTVGEMVNFSLYHEGQHAGLIKGLKYAVKA
jgi:hypothetical protein